MARVGEVVAGEVVCAWTTAERLQMTAASVTAPNFAREVPSKVRESVAASGVVSKDGRVRATGHHAM